MREPTLSTFGRFRPSNRTMFVKARRVSRRPYRNAPIFAGRAGSAAAGIAASSHASVSVMFLARSRASPFR